jgi:hypothetical protein
MLLKIHRINHHTWWTVVDLKQIVDFTWKGTLALVLECYDYHGCKSSLTRTKAHRRNDENDGGEQQEYF